MNDSLQCARLLRASNRKLGQQCAIRVSSIPTRAAKHLNNTPAYNTKHVYATIESANVSTSNPALREERGGLVDGQTIAAGLSTIPNRSGWTCRISDACTTARFLLRRTRRLFHNICSGGGFAEMAEHQRWVPNTSSNPTLCKGCSCKVAR